MSRWLVILFFISINTAMASTVDLNLKMKFTHKKHKEEVNTVFRTKMGELFFIDRKEFRAELQADRHPKNPKKIVIRGKVYKRVEGKKDLLVSRPKMTIPLGKRKMFTVEDRLRRKLLVSVRPEKVRSKKRSIASN